MVTLTGNLRQEERGRIKLERFGALLPGGLLSQFLTQLEVPVIGLDGDGGAVE